MIHLTNTVQFTNGKAVEAFLDEYFGKAGYTIRQTTPHEERVLCLGDRQFGLNGGAFFVEYKSGIQTFYTGNIFLETVSVDAVNKPGWVYTCQADFVYYACLLNGKILVFKPEQLRTKIIGLKQQFREVKTGKGQNSGYNTHGLIVPLVYAEKYLTEKIITLSSKD